MKFNVYSTIFRSVLRCFWSPFLDLGARSPISSLLKKGTFAKRTESKNGLQKPREYGGLDICFMRLPFLGQKLKTGGQARKMPKNLFCCCCKSGLHIYRTKLYHTEILTTSVYNPLLLGKST